MLNFVFLIIGVILGIIVTYCVPKMLSIKKIPTLIGPEEPKEGESMKTYTIINSLGEKEYIMTSKSIPELLVELEKVSREDPCKIV